VHTLEEETYDGGYVESIKLVRIDDRTTLWPAIYAPRSPSNHLIDLHIPEVRRSFFDAHAYCNARGMRLASAGDGGITRSLLKKMLS
jgi:hypothetical protein